MIVKLRYFTKRPNWGDALNPYLIKKLIGVDVLRYGQQPPPAGTHLLAMGSILHWANADSIVWGTGAVSPAARLPTRPSRILAVRGPLTRQICLKHDIGCPEVYGDPALLLPRIYAPSARRERYDVGVILHYVDKQSEFAQRCRAECVKLIDVYADTEQFVDEVCSCAAVLSSSLHGLICADAYGVPSKWIEVSNKVIGQGFKFRDYYASVGRPWEQSAKVGGGTNIAALSALCDLRTPSLDGDALKQVLMTYISGH